MKAIKDSICKNQLWNVNFNQLWTFFNFSYRKVISVRRILVREV